MSETTQKKQLLSGIQPSGQLHIGNYFGAMKQYVDLQDQFNCSFMIADLHTLTSLKDPSQLSQNIIDVYLDYLAIGLDPKESLIFHQSAAPQVTELAWIFSTLVTIPWLERAHAFKDKSAKGLTPNVGLFTYPILMAADIIIAEADVVPVGEDQRQHVEMAREIVRKFNDQYETDILVEPQELIKDEVAVVPGVDGAKMSKSYGNTIPLFASREELQTLAMSVVTASTPKGTPTNPDDSVVYQLYKLVATSEQTKSMAEGFKSGELGFKDAKEQLGESLDDFIALMREKRVNLDMDQAKKDLATAGEVVNQKYQKKINVIKEIVGLK